MYALLAFLFALGSPLSSAVAQEHADSQVMRRLADSTSVSEPHWRFIGGVSTSPPLLDEQLGVSVAVFERKRDPGQPELVEVQIYSVSSAAAASRWIRGFGDGSSGTDWRIAPYRLADEAFMATSPDGKSRGLTIRSGILLIQVQGESLPSVERFAGHVLAAAAAN